MAKADDCSRHSADPQPAELRLDAAAPKLETLFAEQHKPVFSEPLVSGTEVPLACASVAHPPFAGSLTLDGHCEEWSYIGDDEAPPLCDTGAETVRAMTAGLGSSVLASAEGCSRADGCTPMAVRTAPARAALARTDIQTFPVPAVTDGIVMDTDIDAGNADAIV